MIHYLGSKIIVCCLYDLFITISFCTGRNTFIIFVLEPRFLVVFEFYTLCTKTKQRISQKSLLFRYLHWNYNPIWQKPIIHDIEEGRVLRRQIQKDAPDHVDEKFFLYGPSIDDSVWV